MTQSEYDTAIREECLAYFKRIRLGKKECCQDVRDEYDRLNERIHNVCTSLYLSRNNKVYAPNFCYDMLTDIAYNRGYMVSKLSQYMGKTAYKRYKRLVKLAIADLFGFVRT